MEMVPEKVPMQIVLRPATNPVTGNRAKRSMIGCGPAIPGGSTASWANWQIPGWLSPEMLTVTPKALRASERIFTELKAPSIVCLTGSGPEALKYKIGM